MARRSSARLRNGNSATPKRVSLSHDTGAHTPKTVPARLPSLDEGDEMPGVSSNSPTDSPTRPAKRVNIGLQSTPKDSAPIQPADEEMHPQKHHQTAAKPLDEARYLGFSNMVPQTVPSKKASRIATLQATPTRAQNPVQAAKSPTFQFTFRREHSLELSPEAKKLMLEKREEAAKIREQMAASGEASALAWAEACKMATPKGKRSRFSDVHKQAFEKMASIAAHPSSFRADPSRVKTVPLKEEVAISDAKTLKRSFSKANLDEQPAKTLRYSASKPNPQISEPHKAIATSNLRADAGPPASPTKRIKRTEADNSSATRPLSSSNSQLNTPQRKISNTSSLATPTQASLSRAASVKSIKTSKIPAPSLMRSPSKPNLLGRKSEEASATPLLHRSPSKAAILGASKQPINEQGQLVSPLLSRSPLKPAPDKRQPGDDGTDASNQTSAPLLACSPLRMSIAKSADRKTSVSKQPGVPLLARSPSKITLPSNPAAPKVSATSGQSTGLLSRFNLLRASPMKSILRSPQRLYSDDPAKIAAGTHVATPPKAEISKYSFLSSRPPATAPVRKHVDFTSSTKERYEAKSTSSTPSKDSTLHLKDASSHGKPMDVEYPSLPSPAVIVSPSPQNRRQTVAPGDFTFRADWHGLTFSQSPNALSSARAKMGKASIRPVSAEPEIVPRTTEAPPPATGSKKRKFEFENHELAAGGHTSDKENTPAPAGDVDEEARPAKRAKSNPTERKSVCAPSPMKTTEGRMPMLGGKLKGVRAPTQGKNAQKKGRPSTISQARLAALAMPKKRG